MKTIINHFINLIGLLIVGLIGIYLLDLSLCFFISLLNGSSLSSVMHSTFSNGFFWTFWLIYAVSVLVVYSDRFNK